MTGRDEPRHSRAEIRNFAKWMKDQGWVYQHSDSLGHTIWAHPKATGHYKLPETPRGFNVKRARGDVERLLGIKHKGKHRGKPKVSAPRRDFALEQAQRQARERTTPRPTRSTGDDAASAPFNPPRVTGRLPWEGQPDNYDRGIDRLMREVPRGGR